MRAPPLHSLDARDWWLLLSTSALIPAYWVAVRSGLYKPRSWPLRAAEAPAPELPLEAVRRIGALVNAASRYSPFPSTCLTRSLVLISQLRRRNVACSLRIGVCLLDGKLKAHAWVEHQGVPVNDSPDVDSQFAPIDAHLGYSSLVRP